LSSHWAGYFAGDLDTVLAACAPDIEVFPDAAVFPEAGPLHRREAFGRWLDDAASAFASMEFHPRETFVLPDGRVILRYEWGGIGATGGVRALASTTTIVTLGVPTTRSLPTTVATSRSHWRISTRTSRLSGLFGALPAKWSEMSFRSTELGSLGGSWAVGGEPRPRAPTPKSSRLHGFP
jgi:ketosteroid isomerase-like protein